MTHPRSFIHVLYQLRVICSHVSMRWTNVFVNSFIVTETDRLYGELRRTATFLMSLFRPRWNEGNRKSMMNMHDSKSNIRIGIPTVWLLRNRVDRHDRLQHTRWNRIGNEILWLKNKSKVTPNGLAMHANSFDYRPFVDRNDKSATTGIRIDVSLQSVRVVFACVWQRLSREGCKMKLQSERTFRFSAVETKCSQGETRATVKHRCWPANNADGTRRQLAIEWYTALFRFSFFHDVDLALRRIVRDTLLIPRIQSASRLSGIHGKGVTPRTQWRAERSY